MFAYHYATLMAGQWPVIDAAEAFDTHALACILATALGEVEAGEATITQATGLTVRDLGDLLDRRFPGVARAAFGLDVAAAPVIEMEEELLRDLFAAHAAGGGGGSAPFNGAHVANLDATGSSPPSWGRDREGGVGGSLSTGDVKGPAATPLPVPPPQGGRGREGRGPSPIDLGRLVAALVARRAMKPDHLWQDLGLFDRSELNRLLATHFPTLHAGNTTNMRWKKYFYRKLCEAEGFSLCAAPSCAVCADFVSCFGAEDGESRLAQTRRAGDLAGVVRAAE